jgi:predicted nucleotidyltransferase
MAAGVDKSPWSPAGARGKDKPMTDFIPDRLEDLVDDLLCWTRKMPTVTFYIYGSRVRGDHHRESDVDICFDVEQARAHDTIELQIQELEEDGFDLPERYRCRVWDQSKHWTELRERIFSAPVKYRKGNIVCVELPRVSKTSN